MTEREKEQGLGRGKGGKGDGVTVVVAAAQETGYPLLAYLSLCQPSPPLSLYEKRRTTQHLARDGGWLFAAGMDVGAFFVYLTNWRRTWQIARARYALCVRSCALFRLRRCPSPPPLSQPKGRPNNIISEDISIAFVTAVAKGVGDARFGRREAAASSSLYPCIMSDITDCASPACVLLRRMETRA